MNGSTLRMQTSDEQGQTKEIEGPRLTYSPVAVLVSRSE